MTDINTDPVVTCMSREQLNLTLTPPDIGSKFWLGGGGGGGALAKYKPYLAIKNT